MSVNKEINYSALRVTDWLPTSVKEMKALGWESVDVVLFSGDAYVDHPSFGAAVIGRVLQAAGLPCGYCASTQLAGRPSRFS